MAEPLSFQEKEEIAEILEILYGLNNVESRKERINLRTVEELERALITIERCNSDMKDLLAGLLGGAKLLASGWLRRSLSAMHRKIKDQRVKLDGLACRFAGAAGHRADILLTLDMGM